MCLLLEQKEMSRANEDENMRASRKQFLGKMHVPTLFTAYMHTKSLESDDRTKDRYQRTFNHIQSHAPYLQSLVCPGGKKAAELNSLVKEVRA